MMIDGGSDWTLTISPSKTWQTAISVAYFGRAGCLPGCGRGEDWSAAVGGERGRGAWVVGQPSRVVPNARRDLATGEI